MAKAKRQQPSNASSRRSTRVTAKKGVIKTAESTEPPPELPEELILRIANLAPSANELVAMLCVDHNWHAAISSSEDPLWRRLALERFPRLVHILRLAPTTDERFRDVYRNQLAAEAGPPDDPEVTCTLDDFIFTVEIIHGQSGVLWQWSGRLNEENVMEDKSVLGPCKISVPIEEPHPEWVHALRSEYKNAPDGARLEAGRDIRIAAYVTPTKTHRTVGLYRERINVIEEEWEGDGTHTISVLFEPEMLPLRYAPFKTKFIEDPDYGDDEDLALPMMVPCLDIVEDEAEDMIRVELDFGLCTGDREHGSYVGNKAKETRRLLKYFEHHMPLA